MTTIKSMATTIATKAYAKNLSKSQLNTVAKVLVEYEAQIKSQKGFNATFVANAVKNGATFNDFSVDSDGLVYIAKEDKAMATKKNVKITTKKEDTKMSKKATKVATKKNMKVTTENYSAHIAEIKKGGVNVKTVARLNEFVDTYYEDCFDHKPTKKWGISQSGKLYFGKTSYWKYLEKTNGEKVEKKVSTKKSQKVKVAKENTFEARLTKVEKSQKSTDKKIDKILALLEDMN